MGTNFYLQTKVKALVQKYAPYSYELTDYPEFGYRIHIAKTSYGWLPLFEAHNRGIQSVADMKEAYNTCEFAIYDEYGTKYNWQEFTKRVLEFNGGKRGVMPLEEVGDDLMDSDMPNHIPVSHFEYGNGKYADHYFVDAEGYEFDRSEFS